MDIVKMDPARHDLKTIARLIYQTDSVLFPFLFGKNRLKAIQKIERLITAGNNLLGHDFIHLVCDGEIIIAVFIAYSGQERRRQKNLTLFFKLLPLSDALKYLVIARPVMNRTLTSKREIAPDDFYQSNLSVEKNYQGKGIGSMVMAFSLEIAKGKNCKRALLDVSIANPRAMALYERFGYQVYNNKRIRLGKRVYGSYQMEYPL